MSRRTIASVLCVAGLYTAATFAQAPKGDDHGSNPGQSDERKALGEWLKSTDKANGIVAAALANDPDVLVARAKVQLAEAELTKARQGVVLKVMTLNATIEEQKRAAAAAEERYAWAERTVKTGNIPQSHLVDERAKLEAARAALAKAQTELKLLTGGKEIGTDVKPGQSPNQPTAAAITWLLNAQAGEESRHAVTQALIAGMEAYHETHTIKGPVPDRIRAALDKPVKLGTAGTKEKMDLVKAMEIFKKDAGLDVTLRRHQNRHIEVEVEGQTLPVGAWLQLYTDANPDSRIVVREYGLYLTYKDDTPPDAPTVTEFWKRKTPAEKKAKDAPPPKLGGSSEPKK